MLSPLATLLLTWAAIYLYVAVYNLWLYGRRLAHREYLGFGLMNLGVCISTVGSALATDARSLDDGRLALSIVLAGGMSAAPPFVEFALALSGRSRPWARRSAYALALVGLGLLLEGSLLTAGRAPAHLALVGGIGAPIPGLSIVGMVLVAGLLGACVVALVEVAFAARQERDLRWLLLGGSVATLAAIFDNVSRALGIEVIRTLDHAALLPVMAVSYILLRRIVVTASELGDRTKELRRSHGELRVAQEELVRGEQLAAVGELAAVIAHEVRNPLAIIKNAVSSLRRPSLAEADHGLLLGICDEEVDRLNRLVRDLLAYARPVAPKGRVIDVDSLLAETLRESAADHPRVEIAHDLAAGQPIHGDPVLLRQALTNIVENALMAMPKGGTLRASTRETTLAGMPALSLEVSDTGDGMDPDTAGKATDPFFTTRPAGTGLGLAIVERVVRGHGGTIEIVSARGEGTTVVMTLPRERASVLPALPELA